MNIELICWIASWILVSEGLFIWFLKSEPLNDFFSGSKWIGQKIYALVCGITFILLQLCICGWTGLNFNLHYINLLYEFLIILGLAVFFFINKKIADKINGGKK